MTGVTPRRRHTAPGTRDITLVGPLLAALFALAALTGGRIRHDEIRAASTSAAAAALQS